VWGDFLHIYSSLSAWSLRPASFHFADTTSFSWNISVRPRAALSKFLYQYAHRTPEGSPREHAWFGAV